MMDMRTLAGFIRAAPGPTGPLGRHAPLPDGPDMAAFSAGTDGAALHGDGPGRDDRCRPPRGITPPVPYRMHTSFPDCWIWS